MMKIKIFCAVTPSDLEEKMNHWFYTEGSLMNINDVQVKVCLDVARDTRMIGYIVYN